MLMPSSLPPPADAATPCCFSAFEFSELPPLRADAAFAFAMLDIAGGFLLMMLPLPPIRAARLLFTRL